MYRILLLLLFAFAVIGFIPAAKAEESSQCNSPHPDRVLECLGASLERAENDLASIYAKVDAAFNPDGYEKDGYEKTLLSVKKKLRLSQKMWLSYVDKTCNDFVYSYFEGEMKSVEPLRCQIRLTEQRTDALKHLYAELDSDPGDQ